MRNRGCGEYATVAGARASPQRGVIDLDALHRGLEQLDRNCNRSERIHTDPVGLVRPFAHPLDREIVGLLASSLALGTVVAIRTSVRRVLERLGPCPAQVIDEVENLGEHLHGIHHRMIRDVDIGNLLSGARRVQRRWGSLEASFREHLSASPNVREALVRFTAEIREAGLGQGRGGRRGPALALGNPAGTSACKRLWLFLRWMIRADDGVDLGVWTSIPASALLIPVDTHTFVMAKTLGLTDCRSIGWKAAEQITDALRRFDPDDPVRFDFPLCHFAMSRACLGRVHDTRCSACPLQPGCRLWNTQHNR